MEYLWPIVVARFWGPMLLHFKKLNKILETWSPHSKNLAFKDPPSLNFQNRTDATIGKLKLKWHNLLSCHAHKWSWFLLWSFYQCQSCGLTIYCSLYPHPPIYLHWDFRNVWHSPVWNNQFDFFPSLTGKKYQFKISS